MGKTFYLVTGVILLIGPLFLLQDDLDSYRVLQHGRMVDMKIIQMPLSCLARNNGNIVRLEFNKMIFEKGVGGSFCDTHAEGDIIQVKYLPGKERKLMFPDESVWGEFVAWGLITLVGLYSFFKGFVMWLRGGD